MPTLARQVELTPYRRHFSKAWTSARRALRTVSGLGAGIVGAILGSLPGMAIGGIVGLVRRASLPQPLMPNRSGRNCYSLPSFFR